MGSPSKDDGKENLPGNEYNQNSNEKPSRANGTNWHESLNLAFASKMFKPDGPFFARLSQIWELEA